MTENAPPGRKAAESPLIDLLRRIHRGEISPEEAVQILVPQRPPRDPIPPS